MSHVLEAFFAGLVLGAALQAGAIVFVLTVRAAQRRL